jgi:hypothetical protein
MPTFDGTGPNGKGPITGRGSGYCVIPLNTTEQEIDFLNNRTQALRQELEHVETRLSHAESKVGKKE